MKKCFLFALLAFPLLTSCNENPYSQGENLYQGFCANCHMDDGSGLESLIPPLAKADWLRERQHDLACVIRYGIKDTIIVNGTEYIQPMAGIGRLTDTEITNVINYINHAWGNNFGVVKFEDIRASLEDCEE